MKRRLAIVEGVPNATGCACCGFLDEVPRVGGGVCTCIEPKDDEAANDGLAVVKLCCAEIVPELAIACPPCCPSGPLGYVFEGSIPAVNGRCIGVMEPLCRGRGLAYVCI